MEILTLPIVPHWLRELNLLSILCRILLATACGSVIGFERGKKHHDAGLRTHILVCIGAASVMIVNQYIDLFFASGSDPARMGAQVISGIGFLGAGTIVITGHHHGKSVRGLTTAAGLWASACMGLAAGIGFCEVAFLMCFCLFLVIVILNKLDERYFKNAKNMSLYIEYQAEYPFSTILKSIRQTGWHLSDLEHMGQESGVSSILLEIHSTGKGMNRQAIIELLRSRTGVVFAEEM